MASSISNSNEDGESISYLSLAQATAVDELLMGELGFSIDQLVELAGLSVASTIAEVYGVEEYGRVLVICGPGNNGGDGLVAARHLYHFGFKPSICYPQQTNKPIYHGLVTQLKGLEIPFVSAEELPSKLKDEFELAIDAIFGFSSHGTRRPPFDSLLRKLVVPNGTTAEEVGVPPVVSVDIPSGWHVENGDTVVNCVQPEMLVSITAPKELARMFVGSHHFLGGHFLPPAVLEKCSIRLPPYRGVSKYVPASRIVHGPAHS